MYLFVQDLCYNIHGGKSSASDMNRMLCVNMIDIKRVVCILKNTLTC